MHGLYGLYQFFTKTHAQKDVVTLVFLTIIKTPPAKQWQVGFAQKSTEITKHCASGVGSILDTTMVVHTD